MRYRSRDGVTILQNSLQWWGGVDVTRGHATAHAADQSVHPTLNGGLPLTDAELARYPIGSIRTSYCPIGCRPPAAAICMRGAHWLITNEADHSGRRIRNPSASSTIYWYVGTGLCMAASRRWTNYQVWRFSSKTNNFCVSSQDPTKASDECRTPVSLFDFWRFSTDFHWRGRWSSCKKNFTVCNRRRFYRARSLHAFFEKGQIQYFGWSFAIIQWPVELYRNCPRSTSCQIPSTREPSRFDLFEVGDIDGRANMCRPFFTQIWLGHLSEMTL